MALDQGTTSSRAIIFDKKGNIICKAQNEFEQIYPEAGWVEHDPLAILYSQFQAVSGCISSGEVKPSEIAAIGITNQRETTILWDRQTGKPVYNAIVWQCRRTADYCEKLKEEGLGDYIKEKTGLLIDAYFSGTKIKWILDNVPEARRLADMGRLLFGTVETWLIWNLTGGSVHVTDYSNASRTMLFDVDNLCWDKTLCDKLGIPMSILPEPVPSSKIYGRVAKGILGLEALEGIPISGAIGDQPAALFGQACFEPGQAKNTYGTGCFLLAHTGGNIVRSKHGLITTAAAAREGEPPVYALEGSVFVGGAVVSWLRDGMRLIDESHDSEYFARKVRDSNGVYVVPAFTGMGAPYWDMHAQGAILGLTRGTKRTHIIRAALESIAYQTDDVIKSIAGDCGGELTALKVDGGASANDFLMQFQADISNIDVIRAEMKEATAAGAAYLAGLAAGVYKDTAEIKALAGTHRAFFPEMDPEERRAKLEGWHRAVNACRAY
jgi:glycerol kinase